MAIFSRYFCVCPDQSTEIKIRPIFSWFLLIAIAQFSGFSPPNTVNTQLLFISDAIDEWAEFGLHLLQSVWKSKYIKLKKILAKISLEIQVLPLKFEMSEPALVQCLRTPFLNEIIATQCKKGTQFHLN